MEKKKQTRFGRRCTRFLLHEVVDRRQTVQPIRTPFPPRRHVALVCHTRTDAPAFVRSFVDVLPGLEFPVPHTRGIVVILFATTDHLRVPPRPTCVPLPRSEYRSRIRLASRYITLRACLSVCVARTFQLFSVVFDSVYRFFFLLSIFRAHARRPCAI